MVAEYSEFEAEVLSLLSDLYGQVELGVGVICGNVLLIGIVSGLLLALLLWRR